VGTASGSIVYQLPNLTSARIYGAQAQVGLLLGDTHLSLANRRIRSNVAWSRRESEGRSAVAFSRSAERRVGLTFNDVDRPAAPQSGRRLDRMLAMLGCSSYERSEIDRYSRADMSARVLPAALIWSWSRDERNQIRTVVCSWPFRSFPFHGG
jgi:hypothetical protein